MVSGIRAKNATPVTQLTLNQKQIEQRYYGADLPSLLNVTPSINSYSDNGTGIGYSFFRLRGLDQTRINFTINGIPVNDAEMQGTYCNNFADLASSAGSIQVQRGVGTSSNGTAAFAGSVNVITKPLSEKPEAALNIGYGSYQSSRITAEYQSGLLDKKFAFYTRISNLATNGYRQHSGSAINSLFLSGAYFGKKSILKLNVMSGSSQSQLAYTGIDKATLDTARKTNYFVNNETDAFRQVFYQLQYSYQINPYAGIAVSGYYVRGNAPKFQYYLDGSYNTYAYMNMPNAIVGTDTLQYTDAIGSYRLNQHFYGGFVNYFYKKGRVDLNAGIHANAFSSDHFMEVNWARVLPAGVTQNHQAYFNTGYKSEWSAYVKINYALTNQLIVFADMQIRNASFRYKGQDQAIHRDTFSVEKMNWMFFNPKLGLRVMLNRYFNVYAMYGQTSREPTRQDYFLDEYPKHNVKQNDLSPEFVRDFEMGAEVSTQQLTLHANLFYMQFHNQLINTGQLNMVGIPITTNVKKSYRSGIELDFVWKPLTYLWLMNSTCWMQNQIKSYTQFYDSAGAYTTSVGVNYTNTKAALTPDLILNQGVRIIPVHWLYLDVNYRYVAKQYLDNTQDAQLQIKDYAVLDAKVGISLKRWINAGDPSLSLMLNNLLNTAYTPSGSTTGNVMNYDANGIGTKASTGLYFPAATRNYFVTLTWKF